MRYTALYLARHNAVVARLRTAAGKKFEIIAENRAIGAGRLRPDLVLKRLSDGKIFIIDVSIPFDNRLTAFKAARDERTQRYEGLVAELGGNGPNKAEVVPFIVGALGSWDPTNDAFLTKVCSRSYAKKMRKICVSETISFSRDIYIEHLTGTRQRPI